MYLYVQTFEIKKKKKLKTKKKENNLESGRRVNNVGLSGTGRRVVACRGLAEELWPVGDRRKCDVFTDSYLNEMML